MKDPIQYEISLYGRFTNTLNTEVCSTKPHYLNVQIKYEEKFVVIYWCDKLNIISSTSSHRETTGWRIISPHILSFLFFSSVLRVF